MLISTKHAELKSSWTTLTGETFDLFLVGVKKVTLTEYNIDMQEGRGEEVTHSITISLEWADPRLSQLLRDNLPLLDIDPANLGVEWAGRKEES